MELHLCWLFSPLHPLSLPPPTNTIQYGTARSYRNSSKKTSEGLGLIFQEKLPVSLLSLSLSLCAESLDLRPTSVCLHLSLSFMCPFRPNPKWGKPCSTTSPVPRGLQHPVWSDENSSWWLYGSGNQVSVFRCLEIYCFCLVLWAQGDNKRIIPTL